MVTAAEHVGAENDAPLHFRTESFFPRPAIMVEQVPWTLRAMTVPYSVEASEIRRRLGARDHIIRSDRVFRVGQ